MGLIRRGAHDNKALSPTQFTAKVTKKQQNKEYLTSKNLILNFNNNYRYLQATYFSIQSRPSHCREQQFHSYLLIRLTKRLCHISPATICMETCTQKPDLEMCYYIIQCVIPYPHFSFHRISVHQHGSITQRRPADCSACFLSAKHKKASHSVRIQRKKRNFA